jgi:glycosyltransferase involved in cell wall biosynthesis
MTLAVLHVAQPTDAGVPRVASALVADQLARGWDVSVASPVGGDLQRAVENSGARWYPWDARRDPGPSVAGEARRLAGILNTARPELLHLHSAKAGMVGRLVCRGRVPTIFQPHAWSFEAAGGIVQRGAVAWERFGARWADAVVCVSADERRRGAEVGIQARFREVPNGIDLSRYTTASDSDRAAARATLGVDAAAPLAVTIGRLARQKGYDVLLAAWPQVLERVPDAELVIIGEGPDRAALEALGRPGVRFAGASDDVATWLAAADLSVVSSRWEAGLPLVAMESMARGRSVVATDVAGMAEGLDGGCGAVVPVEDADALADAIAARLADRALADAEGAAGRRRVEERHDVRVAADRMASVYDDVLAERRDT